MELSSFQCHSAEVEIVAEVLLCAFVFVPLIGCLILGKTQPLYALVVFPAKWGLLSPSSRVVRGLGAELSPRHVETLNHWYFPLFLLHEPFSLFKYLLKFEHHRGQ